MQSPEAKRYSCHHVSNSVFVVEVEMFNNFLFVIATWTAHYTSNEAIRFWHGWWRLLSGYRVHFTKQCYWYTKDWHTERNACFPCNIRTGSGCLLYRNCGILFQVMYSLRSDLASASLSRPCCILSYIAIPLKTVCVLFSSFYTPSRSDVRNRLQRLSQLRTAQPAYVNMAYHGM